MKAPDWNDRLVADHRSYIADESAREAFDGLVEASGLLSQYDCEPAWQGEVRIFKYVDRASGERPFAFIINRRDLLFYIRKAGLERVAGGLGVLQQSFANVLENRAGEWTIHIACSEDAQRLLRLLFGNDGSRPVPGVRHWPVDHHESAKPPHPSDRPDELLPVLPERRSPIPSPGDGTQEVYPGAVPAHLVTDIRRSLGAQTEDVKRTIATPAESDIHLQLNQGTLGSSRSRPKGVEMTTLRVPAARVRQGALTLYSTSIRVGDLIADGFYSVETLDPENANDRGYQRLLNVARAKKLADYILAGQDSKDAFLPTSVFLATDKSLPFDEATNTLEIDTRTVGAFSVVDGQHRLEGLRMAAEKDRRVHDFELPVNIGVGLPKIAQMCHFLIVNTTQKSVDKSVEQRLIARLTDAIDVEEMPSLPKWILRAVERGDVDKAVRYVDFLNEEPESPWHGKIEMANAERGDATIKQKSLVKSIQKYVLTASNPIVAMRDFDKEKKIFLNYWKAIAQLLDDGNAAVLYKYNGAELFCKFSIPFFMKLQDKGSFTVKTMTELLQTCFDNVEGEYAGVGHPEWWASGSAASFLNAGAINQVSQALSIALNKQPSNRPIEL